MSLVSLVVAVAFSLTVQTVETKAAWGDFDTSFGFQGVTVDTVTGHIPYDTAIQPDGKILVSGYKISILGGKAFFLRRYLSNGQLDTTFGKNGAATNSEAMLRLADYRGDKIVVQANGKIAVAGGANGEYAVWQFHSNGRSDTTFGQNGLQILTGYPIIDSTYPDLNIQNGKLLLSVRKQIGNMSRITLLRLNSNGTFDGTFGTFGESLTDIQPSNFGSGTVIETDGKITVGGFKPDNILTAKLERKLANGQTDLSFSPTPAPWSGSILEKGLVKLANGKYIMRLGNVASSASITINLDKFSSTGVYESNHTLDSRFATDNCPDIFANQNDGKFLIQFAGAIYRLNTDLDFGTMQTNFCSNLNGIGNFAHASIQPDDKMIVVGTASNNLILARLLPN